ncbi:hypothetical protein [Pedobacter terrae]|uniref:hypothetical protein n=1 Tax=Pedobacter terrae TaxID=405671 RepID=UPI002FFB5AE7
MKSNIELIQLLQTVLEGEHRVKQMLIKKFQEEVWNDESIQDETLNEILSELAYDLDFYESNEEWRKESLSYYGDDRLEEVIKTAIQKLQNLSPI